jgi:hypothetical protein
MPSPGWRLSGRTWLDQPALYWETSEIECIGVPWTPSQQLQPSVDSKQLRARIEIWRADILRLWSRDGTAVLSPEVFGIC